MIDAGEERRRLATIAELAESIADEYCPNQIVLPETIIKRKQILISRSSYGDAFDGMLEHKCGRFHIYCNTDRLTVPARVRFTLAHELGHFFIDDHRRALEAGLEPHPSFPAFNGHPSDNPAEREADHFASSLLMPEGRVQQVIRRSDPGMAAVLDIKNQFDTSVTSSALRYIKLTDSDSTIVRWAPDDSLDWKWISDSSFTAGFRKIIDQAAQLPEDSPTRRAMSGVQQEGRFHKGATVASQWFPFITPGSNRDCLLFEHALKLGEFGTITVLVADRTGF